MTTRVFLQSLNFQAFSEKIFFLLNLTHGADQIKYVFKFQNLKNLPLLLATENSERLTV
jgi:hypothetical protein